MSTQRSLSSFLVLLAALTATGCATKVSEMKAMGNPDEMFVMWMGRFSGSEAKASEMALQRASNPQVRQFAQRMVEDHKKANAELERLGEQKGLEVSFAPDQMHRATSAHLMKLNGSEFDKAYMDSMVSGHAFVVSKFENEAAMGKDPEIKAWAQRNLPKLREHLQMARSILDNLGGPPARAAQGSEPGVQGAASAGATRPR
jgi:putative membrane protein